MKQTELWEPEERDILGCEGLSTGDQPAGTVYFKEGQSLWLASSSPAIPSCSPVSCLLALVPALTHLQIQPPVLCRALDLPA